MRMFEPVCQSDMTTGASASFFFFAVALGGKKKKAQKHLFSLFSNKGQCHFNDKEKP